MSTRFGFCSALSDEHGEIAIQSRINGFRRRTTKGRRRGRRGKFTRGRQIKGLVHRLLQAIFAFFQLQLKFRSRRGRIVVVVRVQSMVGSLFPFARLAELEGGEIRFFVGLLRAIAVRRGEGRRRLFLRLRRRTIRMSTKGRRESLGQRRIAFGNHRFVSAEEQREKCRRGEGRALLLHWTGVGRRRVVLFLPRSREIFEREGHLQRR